MNTPKVGEVFSSRIIFGTAALLVLSGLADGQAVPKKAAPAPPAAKIPAPKPAAVVPGKPGASAATHGMPAAGGVRGPATGSSTTTGGMHGPTTTNPAAAGGTGHSITTAGASRPGTTTTTTPVAGHGINTASSTRTTPTGSALKPASPATAANRSGNLANPGGHPLPPGNKVVTTPSGNQVRMRAGNAPGDVHIANRNMDIHHPLTGGRQIEVARPDHSRLVADNRGGYVEHPYTYHEREFAHRTYYYNGREYDRFYHHYPYRGDFINIYSPAVYYRPAFYGWAYNPWPQPISYAWGWGGSPWVGYYGNYFTPYPVYPTASVWLTDYLVSNSLAAAYQASLQANNQPAPRAADFTPLTPQVKDLISAEVQRQIAIENSEAQTPNQDVPDPASSGIQRMLTDNIQHIFVAGREVDLVDATGSECAISEGDALQLTGPPPTTAVAADLVILSSKGGQECHSGTTVSVAIADLQEMQNHMRETIDQGMGELHAKQGSGGLPVLPPSAKGAPVQAAFAASAPAPDKDVASQIKQQTQEAEKAESLTLREAQQSSGPGANALAQNIPPANPVAGAPPSISPGQSLEEVTAIAGKPKTKFASGSKMIYVFENGVKVTFAGGKSVAVE